MKVHSPSRTAKMSMCDTEHSTSRTRRERCRSELNQGTDRVLNRRKPKEYWGDKQTKKGEKSVRVSFVNINGIGPWAKSEKSEDIRKYMDTAKVDVMGISEVGVNWSKVHNVHTIWERTKRWFHTRRIGVSYNTTEAISGRLQQGGTATIVTNEVAHRVKTTGFDESGLGRWSWVLVSGKQGCVTRMVTVYCPTKSCGPSTVYTQQLTHLKVDPISRFWDDLAKDIHKWQAQGEQLIISGDWNEEVAGPNLTRWMGLFSLREAVTHTHGSNPPPTYHRGTHAIDGIFVSHTIQISKAGYLPFNDLPGDHRGIWVDIPQSSILGYRMSDIPTARARRLKLDDPRVVNRYQEILHQYFQQHKIYKRLRRFRQTWIPSSPLTPAQVKEYEEIDAKRAIGMMLASKKCRKLKMGGRKWSPALQRARNTILLWKLIKKRLQGCKVSAKRIVRLKKRLKIKDTHSSLPEVDKQIDRAFQKYKVCRAQHHQLRLNYLERLAKVKAAEGNLKACKVLKNMEHREAMRTKYARIRSTLKKRQSGTTKIHIKTRKGTKEITKKDQMEKHIIKENEAKFHQTEGRCPLLHGKLYRDLGAMGDGPKAQDVLNGTYEPPRGTSEATKTWLKRMKKENPHTRRKKGTSMKEFREGWKKTKERTASGELHMGHFKAGAIHKKIGWVHYQMSQIPMSTGYSPKRWKIGTDVMLLKDPDVYLLDKLRTIVLYEADFNHENKRTGREGMQLALDKNKIADEQFSRPGRSAQDNALSKRLAFDYFRLKKQPFGMCACDLKSCYDRVVHTAASLALQRVGVPLERIKCMFYTIQTLVHHIRTSFGRSRKSFGGKWPKFRKPPQGLGQGNGAGPTIWSILSSTIFEELRDKGFGTDFKLALSTGLFRLCGFSYVDDCDLIADGENATQVHAKLQAMLTLWDELMEVNGAAIATDKCWWYLIDFKWRGGKWSYVSAGEDLELKVRDKSNKECKLKYMKHNEAKEMVGVHLAPDGNHKAQLKALTDKVKEWKDYIAVSPLDDRAVWLALNVTITKGVEYPLAATTLTKTQLHKAMGPARAIALPRSGFTRKFPLAVLYGPVALQGLGLPDPYIYQYCRHIQDIVDQSWHNTPAGVLMKANLEAVKIEAGLYGSLFDQDVEVTWFNTRHSLIIETYKFCIRHNIIFEEPGTSMSQNCRNDESIMAMFVGHGCSKEELIILNRCRLACRVTSISDVAEGNGMFLAQNWVSDHHLPRQIGSKEWPSQGKPTRRDWSLWKTLLQRVTCRPGGKRLRTSLGLWTLSNEQYTQWDWFIAGGSLVKRIGNHWEVYDKQIQIRTRRITFNSQYKEQTRLKPRHLERTTVWVTGNRIDTYGSRRLRRVPCTPAILGWRETLHTFPDAQWITQWSRIPDRDLCRIDATTIGVSDGSFEPTKDVCSCAWVISFAQGIEAVGGGIVPGPEQHNSSYRAELGGLYAQLLVLRAFEMSGYSTHGQTVTIACDGKSALFKSLVISRPHFSTRHKCYDIISRIIEVKESLRCQISPYHVRGHQDSKRKKLNRIEKLNVRMDKLAEDILRTVVNTNADIPDALPKSQLGIIQVDYEDVPITSLLSSTLQNFIAQDRLMDWWKYKGRLKSDREISEIDWNVMKCTMTEASFAMGRFMTKWVSHQIAVGKVMEYRKARDCNDCPRCGHPHENTLHVLRCRHIDSRKKWRRGIKELRKWLLQRQTEEKLVEGLIQTLKQFNKPGNFDSFIPNGLNEDAQRCFEAQAKIGWTGFLEGMLVNQWAEFQDIHYKKRGSRKSGHRWAVELSKKLWRLVFSMWDHRNNALFAKGKVDKLSGIDKVKTAIAEERSRGIGTLDPSFRPYFALSTETFAKMKSINLRRWLSLIRQAREDQGIEYADEFSTSFALRDWIGLALLPQHLRNHQQLQERRRQEGQLRRLRTGYRD